MLFRVSSLLSLFLVLVAACAEATDGVIDAAWTPPYDPDPDGPVDGASGSSPPTSRRDAATVVTGSPVLLNELSGSGEWVEVVNAGTAPVDMGGWMVADLDKTTGGPKTEDGALLPDGTILGPGAYGMVVGGGLDAGKPCPGEGATFCVAAAFGISRKNGETIFLLARDAAVLGTMLFPASDAGNAQSWCREPNADPGGRFQVCAETPARPN